MHRTDHMKYLPDMEVIKSDMLDEVISAMDAYDYDFELVGESAAGKTVISFSINRFRNTDEDDDENNSTVVPFQVAYAISIHKAQGL